MADHCNAMTDTYWWTQHAWNDLTVELIQHFNGGYENFRHVEFMMEYAQAASEGDKERGQAHISSIAPTSDFLSRAHSALGDCLIDGTTGTVWYQNSEVGDVGEYSRQFERWFYYFTKSHYPSVTILPSGLPAGYLDYTKFGDRSLDLLQYVDWSEPEAIRIVEQHLKLLWSWPLSAKVENWKNLVSELDVFDAPAVHWASLLANPYLPVGDAAGVYDVLADALVVHLRGMNMLALGSEKLLALFSANPNTPSKYVTAAYDIASAARSDMDKNSPNYDVRSQVSLLDRHILSLRTHPNGPGAGEAETETAGHFPDSALFKFFSTPKEKIPSTGFLAHLARELLTNPEREDVLRRILSHLFVTEDAARLALLLPAVGAVLHEFDDALGDTSEKVPFEWLMAAAG